MKFGIILSYFLTVITSICFTLEIFANPVVIKIDSKGNYSVAKDGGPYGLSDGQNLTPKQAEDLVGCSTGGDCSMFPGKSNLSSNDEGMGFCNTAEECASLNSQVAKNSTATDASSKPQASTVIVTEEIPGAGCTCITEETIDNRDARDIRAGAQATTVKNCSNPATRKYSCTIKPGFSSFETMLATIIRYVVFISMLLGVLALVIMGILWSIAGADEPKVKALRGWFINILVGLALLFFFRFILVTLAPWIYQ